MLLVDGVIAFAGPDPPGQWRRYETIAPRVIGNIPDAARELLRRRLARGSYDGLQRGWGTPEEAESVRLEHIFLERFVAAVHDGRCSVWGVPRGGSTATMIDPVLITVAAFKHIKGEQVWELAGSLWFGVHVVVGPPPISKLRPASDPQIHAEIKAEYDDCEATGRKPPNEKEIGAPVQERLRAKGRYASLNRIQKFARDPRYDGLRRKPGRMLASERKRS
jgi:hypothetical protein